MMHSHSDFGIIISLFDIVLILVVMDDALAHSNIAQP